MLKIKEFHPKVAKTIKISNIPEKERDVYIFHFTKDLIKMGR